VFTGFWLGGPKGRDPLVKPRRRWEDNIKTDLRDRNRWDVLDSASLG
jgi:hypothetical protein